VVGPSLEKFVLLVLKLILTSLEKVAELVLFEGGTALVFDLIHQFLYLICKV
jgi:hypothetical protein